MFHGCLVALVTPMHADGAVDYESLQQLVEWHLVSGTDALVVLGTTGESVTIELDERAQIIRSVVEQVNERIPVIIGTGANATQHSITYTQQAMELGADAALLVTPYYNKPTQEGLYQHFKLIAKSVPIPQILYNVPSRTGCDLLPETVARLADVGNIIALKEATGDLQRLEDLLALNCEIDYFSGDDKTAMEFMLKGGKGVISVAANVTPQLMSGMSHAALAGDREKAQALNNKLAGLYENLMIESNPIPTKWALQQMGKIESGIRLPLTPLSDKFHAKVKHALQQALEDIE